MHGKLEGNSSTSCSLEVKYFATLLNSFSILIILRLERNASTVFYALMTTIQLDCSSHCWLSPTRVLLLHTIEYNYHQHCYLQLPIPLKERLQNLYCLRLKIPGKQSTNQLFPLQC